MCQLKDAPLIKFTSRLDKMHRQHLQVPELSSNIWQLRHSRRICHGFTRFCQSTAAPPLTYLSRCASVCPTGLDKETACISSSRHVSRLVRADLRRPVCRPCLISWLSTCQTVCRFEVLNHSPSSLGNIAPVPPRLCFFNMVAMFASKCSPANATVLGGVVCKSVGWPLFNRNTHFIPRFWLYCHPLIK